jgi:hypothetical protein
MKWEDYAKRRKLNIKPWLYSKGITNMEMMLSYLSQINVEVGNYDELEKLFANPDQVVDLTNLESSTTSVEADPPAKIARARKK